MFQDTDAGADSEFEQSYAASGEQRRAIEEGLADFFHASLEPRSHRPWSTQAWSTPTGTRTTTTGCSPTRSWSSPFGLEPGEHPDPGRPKASR